MPVTRAEVADALAIHDEDALRAILDAAGVPARRATSARELAERITDALWWTYCTPLGYVASRTTLEDIVGHVARRVGKRDVLTAPDAWGQLRELTVALVRDLGPVTLADLDPKVRDKLWPSWVPSVAYAFSATGSYGAAAVGKLIVKLGATPVGRVLPLLPAVGPWFKALRTGAGAAAVVGGPLALALGVLSVNSAFGTSYERLVPLLLGVGALGPQPVQDAEVVDDAPTHEADDADHEDAEPDADADPLDDAPPPLPEDDGPADEPEADATPSPATVQVPDDSAVAEPTLAPEPDDDVDALAGAAAEAEAQAEAEAEVEGGESA